MSNYLVGLYRQKHLEEPNYGASKSRQSAEFIVDTLKRANFTPDSVMDFGCGKSILLNLAFGPEHRNPPMRHVRYDPAIDEHSRWPDVMPELVISTDVFEHLPESEVAEVIGATTAGARAFIHCIHFKAACATLADGRNAHETQRPAEWWLEQFRRHSTLDLPVHHVPHQHAFKGWFISVPGYEP